MERTSDAGTRHVRFTERARHRTGLPTAAANSGSQKATNGHPADLRPQSLIGDRGRRSVSARARCSGHLFHAAARVAARLPCRTRHGHTAVLRPRHISPRGVCCLTIVELLLHALELCTWLLCGRGDARAPIVAQLHPTCAAVVVPLPHNARRRAVLKIDDEAVCQNRRDF